MWRAILVLKICERLKAGVIRQCILKSERQATLFKSGFLQNARKPTGGCQCLGPPHKEVFTVLAYSFTGSPPILLFYFELFCNLILLQVTASVTTTRILEESVYYPLFNSLRAPEGICGSPVSSFPLKTVSFVSSLLPHRLANLRR